MADYVNDATLDGPDTRDGVGTATPASGRSELSSLPEIAAGANIGGRYEVIRRLGEGGMGAVYEAEHTAIQRRVALKVLHAEFGRNPSVVERFLQEARAVNAVRHRNVVEVMDFGVDDGRPWLVMELLSGESLAARIERQGAGDPAWAVRTLDPLCRALHQAHQRGFIHRDVKPDNVFLVSEEGGEEVPKLLDFGIAKNLLEDRKLTATGAMVGTPAYMAPEQITDPRSVTAACDQYAVGAMAYEMLTGRLPHEAETFHGLVLGKVQGASTPILDHRPDLAPALAAAVMRALALKPADRHPDIESLRLALLESLGPRESVEAPTPPQDSAPAPAPYVLPAPEMEPAPEAPPPSPPSRSRLWIAALLAPVAIAALLFALFGRTPPSPSAAVAHAAPPIPTPIAVAPPVEVAPTVAVAPPVEVAPAVAIAPPVEATHPVPSSRAHRPRPDRRAPHNGRLQIDSHNPLR